MFVSRLADAHAAVQPRTYAYRSDRHVLRSEDPHQYAFRFRFVAYTLTLGSLLSLTVTSTD